MYLHEKCDILLNLPIHEKLVNSNLSMCHEITKDRRLPNNEFKIAK